jgi:hypothetical protein
MCPRCCCYSNYVYLQIVALGRGTDKSGTQLLHTPSCFRHLTASDVRLLQTLQTPNCFRRLTASDVQLLQTPDCFRRPNCFRRPTASDARLLQTPDCFKRPTAVAAAQANKRPRSDSGSSDGSSWDHSPLFYNVRMY